MLSLTHDQDRWLLNCFLLAFLGLWVTPHWLSIAVFTWWGANTISHFHLHRAIFKNSLASQLFSRLLTAMLGIPQSLWKSRHLAHHAEKPPVLKINKDLIIDGGILALIHFCIFALAADIYFFTYLPGIGLALLFCQIHGYFEHQRGTTTSHYGSLYNFIFFNDGYHIEHHLHPKVHWSELPQRKVRFSSPSSWPAILRWLDGKDPQSS